MFIGAVPQSALLVQVWLGWRYRVEGLTFVRVSELKSGWTDAGHEHEVGVVIFRRSLMRR